MINLLYVSPTLSTISVHLFFDVVNYCLSKHCIRQNASRSPAFYKTNFWIRAFLHSDAADKPMQMLSLHASASNVTASHSTSQYSDSDVLLRDDSRVKALTRDDSKFCLKKKIKRATVAVYFASVFTVVLLQTWTKQNTLQCGSWLKGDGFKRVVCWPLCLDRWRLIFSETPGLFIGCVCPRQGCGVGGKISDLSRIIDSRLNIKGMKFGC